MLGDQLRQSDRYFALGADGIPGRGAAEQITLAFVATLRRHQVHLLLRFAAFSDHGFVEAGAVHEQPPIGAGVAEMPHAQRSFTVRRGSLCVELMHICHRVGLWAYLRR